MRMIKYSIAVSMVVLGGLAFADVPQLLDAPFNPVNEGIYLGADAGYALLNTKVDARTATMSDEVKAGFAGGVFGGYQFSRNWALEAGYNYLSRYKNELTSGGTTTKNNANVYQIYVAGRAKYFFEDHFNAFIKLGAAYNCNIPNKVDDGDLTKLETISEVRPYGAIGVGYLLSQNVEATLQVSTVTGHNFNFPIQLVYGNIGLSYIFSTSDDY